MHDLPLLLTFIAAAAVLTLTPGVDTALVLRAALSQGRRAAVLAATGIALGCLAWGAAVARGLGALLQAAPLAYHLVKLAGAAWLVRIGLGLLLRPRAALAGGDDQAGRQGHSGAFATGLLTNLLNPKVGVFYITFLPQFIPEGVNVAGYSFFLASLHVLLSLVWFAILIGAATPLAGWLRRPAAIKALDRLTGGVLVAFGVRLAVSGLR